MREDSGRRSLLQAEARGICARILFLLYLSQSNRKIRRTDFAEFLFRLETAKFKTGRRARRTRVIARVLGLLSSHGAWRCHRRKASRARLFFPRAPEILTEREKGGKVCSLVKLPASVAGIQLHHAAFCRVRKNFPWAFQIFGFPASIQWKGQVAPGGAQGLSSIEGGDSWITLSIVLLFKAFQGLLWDTRGSAPFPFSPRNRFVEGRKNERRGNHGIHKQREATRWNRRPAMRHMPLVAGGTRDQVHVSASLQSRDNRQRQVPGPRHFRLRRPKPLLQVD